MIYFKARHKLVEISYILKTYKCIYLSDFAKRSPLSFRLNTENFSKLHLAIVKSPNMATVMVYYQWLVVQQKHATKNLVFEVVQWASSGTIQV